MLQRYAEIELPRYTSYPTAAQFNNDVGEQDYRKWLSDIARDQALSLYVHVPFCETLCWYCACHTTIVHAYGRVAEYVEVLKRELKLVHDALPAHHKISQLHFGGGTPTILSPKDFVAFVDGIRGCFDLQEDAEIAVEIDPRTLTKDKAESLGTAGVTRASLGVQVLSLDVQKTINRIQPFEDVATCVDQLHKAGVMEINFDLMYGLPGQTLQDVKQSIELCTSLNPDRFAVFGYAHVPWFKKHQRCFNESDLPGSQQRLEQAMMASELLVSGGYCRVGFDHFAKPGDSLAVAARTGQLRRNFQGYTTDDAGILLGLGASSISSLGGAYVQNAPRLDHHRDRVDAGCLPITRGIVLTGEDKLRRTVIERIMCLAEVDVGAICNDLGYRENSLDASLEALAPMADDGMVELTNRSIKMTDRGRPFVRNIASCFDAHWNPSPARHSRAV